jgi:hypothetical protein
MSARTSEEVSTATLQPVPRLERQSTRPLASEGGVERVERDGKGRSHTSASS